MSRKTLENAVVVITGASSGIGRATALEFACRGAVVIAAERGEAALRTLVAECERMGGCTLVAPTDVTDEVAVRCLAELALSRYGRFDAWVNCAGVALYGRFEDAVPDAFRQVIETNLFGYVYGARAVLPIFRRQCAGTLINVASVVDKIGTPYLSSYAISKYAILGLSECLRMETLHDRNISVCTVLPASIDTPIFQQSGNLSGKRAGPVPPVYDVATAAHAIRRCAEKPTREVYVGAIVPFLSSIHTLAPHFFERIGTWMVKRTMFQPDPAPPTLGGRYTSHVQGSMRGGWGSLRGGALSRQTVTAAVLLSVTAGWLWRRAWRARQPWPPRQTKEGRR